MTVSIVKIFPPIGIARLGNSTDKFFIGPEIPGNHGPPPDDGLYRDASLRIKRQAARFRLFGYEAGASEAHEIKQADVDGIKWTVKLANTKAASEVFGRGVNDRDHPHPTWLRNAGIQDRDSLKITPGSRTLDGPNQSATFDTGTFRGRDNKVFLGEIKTDAENRLIVLGGLGKSGPDGTDLTKMSPGGDFADHDDWYDDISDGPVQASVLLKGTDAWIEASAAWVICAPPKFAPQIEHIITLYDTLLQMAIDKLGLNLSRGKPSFTKDVYPILLRAMNMKWLTKKAAKAHSGPVSAFDSVLPRPGPDTDDQVLTRNLIFKRLRDPSTKENELPEKPKQDMPRIWSDRYKVDKGTKIPINKALTKYQYHILEQWKKKDGFENDWEHQPSPETEITPEGLTRAALENCIGGAFYPGIETSFMIRDDYIFVEPFRLDSSKLEAGDLTKQMAVPWQTDFLECATENGEGASYELDWWPAQRPVDVFPAGPDPNASRVAWDRGINSSPDGIQNMHNMIRNWHKLGFVVQQGDLYVETERLE